VCHSIFARPGKFYKYYELLKSKGEATIPEKKEIKIKKDVKIIEPIQREKSKRNKAKQKDDEYEY